MYSNLLCPLKYVSFRTSCNYGVVGRFFCQFWNLDAKSSCFWVFIDSKKENDGKHVGQHDWGGNSLQVLSCSVLIADCYIHSSFRFCLSILGCNFRSIELSSIWIDMLPSYFLRVRFESSFTRITLDTFDDYCCPRWCLCLCSNYLS